MTMPAIAVCSCKAAVGLRQGHAARCTHGRAASLPAVANGLVFVGSDDGKLYAFGLSGRKANGKIVFDSNRRGNYEITINADGSSVPAADEQRRR